MNFTIPLDTLGDFENTKIKANQKKEVLLCVHLNVINPYTYSDKEARDGEFSKSNPMKINQ